MKAMLAACASAAAAVLLGAAGHIRAPDAHAQSCVLPSVSLELPAEAIDVRIASVTAEVAPGADGQDMVFLRWVAAPEFDCILVLERRPGETEYPREPWVGAPAAGDPHGANVIALPRGIAGEYCYAVVPVQGNTRGLASEVCVEVANPGPPEEETNVEFAFPAHQDPLAFPAQSGNGGWDWGTAVAAGLVAAVAAFVPTLLALRGVGRQREG